MEKEKPGPEEKWGILPLWGKFHRNRLSHCQTRSIRKELESSRFLIAKRTIIPIVE